MTKHLSPHHPSMKAFRRRPYGYGSMPVSAEHGEFLERMAIDVFTDMTMNGHTFIQAIAAIYLTGLENGAAASA